MNSARRSTRPRTAWACAASLTAMAVTGAALPARAQDAAGAQRLASPVSTGIPATTPMTDLLTRMDALEAQLARLTAQNEEMANRQRQLETRLNPPGAGPNPAAAAPAATASTAPLAVAPAPAAAAAAAPVASSATATNLSAMTGGASGRTGADHAAGPARPSAQRIAAVEAVIKPQTGDAGLDEYSYGFRLYTAKFYPEAAQQLKIYIDKYPRDAHIGFARNLLGRVYLDDGKPNDAAPWFLTNYKTDPQGPRAADSLLNLAEAMRQLGYTSRACVALNEFAATYAAEAKGRLHQEYARTRGDLTCN